MISRVQQNEESIFAIDDERIREEWLHAYPRGRKQVRLDRDGDQIYFPGEGLRGEKLELARRTGRTRCS